MKICLIGSTKFKDQFIEANEQLTAAGHVVYSVAFHSHAEGRTLGERQKETLDLVHLQKILNSDAVMLITDHTTYIGDSTRRELKWATMNNKKIYRWGTLDSDNLLAFYPDTCSYLKPGEWQ